MSGCEFGYRCRRITREYEWPTPPSLVGAPLCGQALVLDRASAVAPGSHSAVKQAVAAGDLRLIGPSWALALGSAGATERLGAHGAEQLRARLMERLDAAICAIVRENEGNSFNQT